MLVPETIQSVLRARIDRLADAPRRLLQTAAVLGRAFSPRVLTHLCDEPDTLEPLLRELQRLEFLYERQSAEESLYVFKHALTQEVAYESLAPPHRQVLHAAAGQALEALYADRLEAVDDRLAYHYARTTDAAKAVEYLARLARKAARSYAIAEAVTALQEALRHVEQLPDASRDQRALELVIRQARLLTFLGRLPQALDLLLHHQARLEHIQAPDLDGPYYALLGMTYSLLGHHDRATQSAQRALEPATRCADNATLGRTYYLLAMEAMWTGHYQQGVAYGHQAIACLEQARDQRWLGQAYWITGANQMFRGEFAQALEAESQAQVIGEAMSSRRLQSYAAWTTGLTYTLMGVWEEGIGQCQRAAELAPDPFCTTEALGFLGYAYLEKGDAQAALSALEQAAQRMQRFGFRRLESWFTVWWGEAHRLGSQFDRARELVLQGLDIAIEVKFWLVVGWAQRALGHITLARGAYGEAATHLQEALDTFSTLQARAEIARTRFTLAALAHAQGSRETTRHLHEAHTMFQALQMPVYVNRTRKLANTFGVSLTAKSN